MFIHVHCHLHNFPVVKCTVNRRYCGNNRKSSIYSLLLDNCGLKIITVCTSPICGQTNLDIRVCFHIPILSIKLSFATRRMINFDGDVHGVGRVNESLSYNITCNTIPNVPCQTVTSIILGDVMVHGDHVHYRHYYLRWLFLNYADYLVGRHWADQWDFVKSISFQTEVLTLTRWLVLIGKLNLIS